MNSKTGFVAELDKEWIQLIMEAKNLGVELSDVKEFLNKNKLQELGMEN